MEDKVEEPNKGSYIQRVWTRISAMMSPRPAASQEQGSGREVVSPFLASLPDEEADACNLRKVSLEPNTGSYIQRVWTDVDIEIGLLNGIIDYNTRNGRYPFCHFDCFDDFIANWLQVDVPKHRLIDVVRKLRKKYLTNMVRKGATVDFADPRDQIAFNLANKIWGTAQGNDEDWKAMKFEW